LPTTGLQPALGGRLSRSVVAFRNYNYRLFWSSQLISQAGAWMQKVAQAWLVLELTHSPLALGTVTALQFLPILCGSMFFSVFVDRMPKHRLLLGTQFLALVQSAILAVLTAGGHIQLWHLYALALFMGLINSVDNPTRLSFVMELVGRENVVNAVSLNSAMNNGARLLGPAIAGAIIAAWGVPTCFFINAVSFLAVLIALLLMRPSEFHALPVRSEARRNPLAELGESLRFLFGVPRLVVVIIMLAGLGCFGFNYNTVVPLIAEQGLHVGAEGFGLLMTAVGLGALLGAITVAGAGRSSRRRILIAGTAFGLAQLVLAFAPSFITAFALLSVQSFAGMLFTTASNTTLQLGSPDSMRGRVMGLYTTLLVGTTPIGAVLTGALTDAAGVRTTVAAWGGVCLLSVAAALVYGFRARRTMGSVAQLPSESSALAEQAPVDSGAGQTINSAA